LHRTSGPEPDTPPGGGTVPFVCTEESVQNGKSTRVGAAKQRANKRRKTIE